MMPSGIPSRRKPSPKLPPRQRLAKNPQLARKLHQMAMSLSPFVQINTGVIHPHFPKTILQFWLLTEAQLEDLASFYHQRGPSSCELGARYPCPIVWRSDAPLEEKRYNLGRFIGLLSGPPPLPLPLPSPSPSPSPSHGRNINININMKMEMKTEEQISEEVRLASRDAAAWRRKMNLDPFSN